MNARNPDITVDAKGRVRPAQVDLLPATPPAPDAPHSPDHIGAVASRKAGVDGWVWCQVEAIGDGFVAKGGAPRLLKNGPRRGQLTWRDSEITSVIVTEAEVRAEEARYEREEAKCHKCGGFGRVLAGWSKTGGKRYAACKRCSGTGKPPTGASP